ncbi:SMI1/KNR4 family protein [Archangium gephyra]|uniref:SMI1/KNR4 family protein n=1 Tax=Archangium gephyra TaxID=48 RepID=UPI003B7BAFF7
MVIRWEPYVWDAPRPADPRDLEILEQQWGVRLPMDYRSLVLSHQGMTPEPSAFKAGAGRDVFCVLLTLSTDEEREEYSIRRVYGILKPFVPAGLFPFALTPGGEFLCFDYRASPGSPRIALVSVEMSISAVADGFSEFLSNLSDG